MKPEVSIITVAYNSEKTIAQTIESVLNQTVAPLEYLIIDGVSKDKTLEIVEGYRGAFEAKNIDYRVISEPDNGFYDAMNIGISMAKGDFNGMINSDDWYENNVIERVKQLYQEHKFAYCFSNIRMYKPDETTFIKKAKDGKIASSRGWNHPTSFVSKEIYKQFKYACESLHDDFDFFLKVKKRGYSIYIADEVWANFRMNGVSHEKSLKRTKQRIKARYSIYRKNGYSRLYILECLGIEAVKWIVG